MATRLPGGIVLLIAAAFILNACDSSPSTQGPATDGRTSVYDNEYGTVEEYADTHDVSFEVAECEFRLDEQYTANGRTYDPAAVGRACGSPHDLP